MKGTVKSYDVWQGTGLITALNGDESRFNYRSLSNRSWEPYKNDRVEFSMGTEIVGSQVCEVLQVKQ